MLPRANESDLRHSHRLSVTWTTDSCAPISPRFSNEKIETNTSATSHKLAQVQSSPPFDRPRAAARKLPEGR